MDQALYPKELLLNGYMLFYEEHVANVRIQLKERRQIMIRALNEYCADVATWDILVVDFYMAKGST